MSEAAIKHDRRFCLDCNKRLNGHEWLYGACSACIKQRAKANGWRPKDRNGNSLAGWVYADNAPRWKEYGDFHDMDEDGMIRLIKAINGGGSGYARKAAPAEDLKVKRQERGECVRCGAKLPEGCEAKRCPECLGKSRLYAAQWRQERRMGGLSHER